MLTSAEYLAAAHDLDAIGARCAGDDRLAHELKWLAVRQRRRADIALHPNSRAWAMIAGARHGDRGILALLINAKGSSKKSDGLAALVNKALKNSGVADNDPYKSALASALAEEAKRHADRLRAVEACGELGPAPIALATGRRVATSNAADETAPRGPHQGSTNPDGHDNSSP